jgi:hypothetical protein
MDLVPEPLSCMISKMLAERGRSQEVENKAFGIELIRPIFPWHRL